MGATDRWRERIVLDVPGEVLMKILEVPDFNRPDRRVSFAMKGDVPVGFEEDYSRLPEVSERVCLYSTDDVVPFGCLATCIAVEEDHRADGRLILNAKFEDIQGTFWYVQEVLEERGIEVE
jgi:hypothetical protein